MVGDAIAPRPAALAVSSSIVDGRRAVAASGRCACAGRRRSYSRLASRLRTRGLAGRVVPARGGGRVERLEAVHGARPRQLRARPLDPAARSRRAAPGRRPAGSSCAPSVSASRGLEQQSAARRRRAARRTAAGSRRDRHRAGGRSPAAASCDAGATPVEAATTTSARARCVGLASVGRPGELDAVAQRRGSCSGEATAAGSRSQIVAVQSPSSGSLRRPRRKHRSAPRSSSAE